MHITHTGVLQILIFSNSDLYQNHIRVDSYQVETSRVNRRDQCREKMYHSFGIEPAPEKECTYAGESNNIQILIEFTNDSK